MCGGLKGLPDAIAQVWSATITQTCIVHLLRNFFKYAVRKDWAAVAKDLKPVYTAPSEAAALDRFAEFNDVWERKYPAMVRLWTNAWAECVAVPAVRHRNSLDHLYDERDRDHLRRTPVRRPELKCPNRKSVAPIT